MITHKAKALNALDQAQDGLQIAVGRLSGPGLSADDISAARAHLGAASTGINRAVFQIAQIKEE